MSNSKKITSIAFTGAAAAAATMMGVAPALAASHVSVKNGGVLYKGTVKAKLKGRATLEDTTLSHIFTCTTGVASGSVSHSTGTTPAQVGFFKKSVTKWSSCFGLPQSTFKAHLIESPKIIVTKITGTGASGKLTGISMKISGTGLQAICHATFSGTSIPWKYVNATHSLKINSGHKVTLRAKSASLCINWSKGNNAWFSGIYHVSTPTALTIS